MADRAMAGSEPALVQALTAWFEENRRPLPWRSSTPWGVLVSEFMLQQTPVDRVIPVWHAWLERWPTPGDLAAEGLGEVLRAWGRMGYPRRAQRLRESAIVIVTEHGGEVPEDEAALRALPGVGEYTAAAVMAFAFGRRSIVLDTNVRRVLSRVLAGEAAPPAHLTAAERAFADRLWPAEDESAARWSASVMEFGALVCRSRAPECDRCPVAASCAWLVAGRPAALEPVRRQAQYEGSDRQARGAILHRLRASSGPVSRRTLIESWPDRAQAERALDSLEADGLVMPVTRGRVALASG